MFKLIFINSRGQSVELFGAPYRLFKVEGIGDVEAEEQSQKAPYQDGDTFIDLTLEPRYISVELKITGKTKEELSTNRKRLASVFNPKLGLGTLQYINGDEIKEIIAFSESVPVFPDGSTNRGTTFQKALIYLKAPNPYFRNIQDEKTEIAFWEPSFEFPLEIPEEGIEMGSRSPSLIVNVLNEGHVDAGMIIKFRAIGTVVNPSLVNVNTGESFKLNRTLTAGEVVTINTNRGKKRIESMKNGVTTNIFNNIMHGSKFLQLSIGDNLFRYDAEQNLEQLEVDIYHSPQFVGV